MRHRWWVDGDNKIRGGGLDSKGSMRRHRDIGRGAAVRILAFVGQGRELKANKAELAELTVLVAGLSIAVKEALLVVWRGEWRGAGGSH